MSKTYIVSRNGGTVTKAPINDNKIPIYANETALDADLANIPDNTLVATRGGHDDVIDQMKEYIRNQTILSGWEVINETTNEYTCPYDGFISFSGSGTTNAATEIFVNGISACSTYASPVSNGWWPIPVNKGDKVTATIYSVPTTTAFAGNWYKLRDYTGR